MVFGTLIGSIILWLIGLFIVYFVISIAVRDGINKSVVGQFIEKKYGVKYSKRSFLDKDLDNNK